VSTLEENMRKSAANMVKIVRDTSNWLRDDRVALAAIIFEEKKDIIELAKTRAEFIAVTTAIIFEHEEANGMDTYDIAPTEAFVAALELVRDGKLSINSRVILRDK